MSPEARLDTPLWYVIQTHTRQEDRTDSNLRAGSIETFSPKVRERRVNKYTGAATYISKPLFPRYIFAKFKINDLYHQVRYTRGVYGLVGLSDGPSPVDEEIIAAIRERVGKDGWVRLGDEFEPGDRVRILAGPFKNFEGIFERDLDDHERVRILLQTVSFQAHVEVEREILKKQATFASL